MSRFAAWLSAILVTTGLGAQPPADSTAAPGTSREPSQAPVEEVIVRGRNRAALLRQIEMATEAIYLRFNDINSTDDFDITCRDIRVTGSTIKRRECKPRFRADADAFSARTILAGLQGSAGSGQAQLVQHEAMVRQAEMMAEMRRLVLTDAPFRASSQHLASLLAALDEDSRSQDPDQTSAYLTSSLDEPLPFAARVMADVYMGRAAWEHPLVGRTFTLYAVTGDIEAMSVRCRGERIRLEFAADSEWTLPADWTDCTLRISAARGATFSLLEFD